MVYCKLIEVTKEFAKYAIGGFVNDLTGELVISRLTDEYEVTKKPENSKVYRIHIEKMLRKHHKEFVSGEFKERLAYEI